MEYAIGNVFVREMIFNTKDDVIEGHEHNFDHVTYVVRGSLKIEKLDDNGKPLRTVIKRATEPHNYVRIAAGVRHRITPVEVPALGHCIYAHRTPQGQVVQEYTGWEGAYI